MYSFACDVRICRLEAILVVTTRFSFARIKKARLIYWFILQLLCSAYHIIDSFKLPVLNLAMMENSTCAHVLKHGGNFTGNYKLPINNSQLLTSRRRAFAGNVEFSFIVSGSKEPLPIAHFSLHYLHWQR